MLHLGDCLGVLRGMPAASVDSVVTDPPYNLSFMGRAWDVHKSPQAFQDWCLEWAAEALRVLKPGAHLVAFGGTRTYHRLACAIEDAGFEIRDSLHWIYGSGFPKSLDVSKAIDKAAGAERKVVADGQPFGRGSMRNRSRVEMGYRPTELNPDGGSTQITAPATKDAVRWAGWGTGLKPAHESIILARKPLAGTVVENVLTHGTGALNIDGCRVAGNEALVRPSIRREDNKVLGKGLGAGIQNEPSGRWPPNAVFTHDPACVPAGARQVRNPSGSITGAEPSAVAQGIYAARERVPWQAHGQNGTETVAVYDCAPGCPVAELDAQSGVLHNQDPRTRQAMAATGGQVFDLPGMSACYADKGGASRFFPIFRYQAKAPGKERPRLPDGTAWPTVKPLGLMRWLVRLVTPPGGLVLDPFAGTGTTGQACAAEGFRCVLVERDATAVALIYERFSETSQAEFLF